MDARPRPTPTPTPRESLLRARADTRRAKRPPLHTRRHPRRACKNLPNAPARRPLLPGGRKGWSADLPCRAHGHPIQPSVSSPFPHQTPGSRSHDSRVTTDEPYRRRSRAPWQPGRIVGLLLAWRGAETEQGTKRKSDSLLAPFRCSLPVPDSRPQSSPQPAQGPHHPKRSLRHWQSKPTAQPTDSSAHSFTGPTCHRDRLIKLGVS